MKGAASRSRPTHRHLPRRTLPPYRQAPRQTQGPGRGCPLDLGHYLALARRSSSPLPRPRIRLPHASTPNASCATTSPNSPPRAIGSPSNPPPEPPNTHQRNLTRLRKLRRVLRLPTTNSFSGQTGTTSSTVAGERPDYPQRLPIQEDAMSNYTQRKRRSDPQRSGTSGADHTRTRLVRDAIGSLATSKTRANTHFKQ